MCLIILLPSGTDKKSDFIIESVKKASVTNKDGIGLMYKDGENIVINKGFTDVDKFIESYTALDLSTESQVAIHLRYGNKGAVNAAMSHPFICSDDEEEIVTLSGTTDKPVLMHNGTFIGLTLPAGKSDTFVFTKEFMSDNDINSLFYNNVEMFKKIFKSVLGPSRLLVFYPGDKDFQKIGSWFEQDGYFFSNETFKRTDIKDIGGVTEEVKTAGLIDLRARNRKTQATYKRSSNSTPSDGVRNLLISPNSVTYTRTIRVDYLKDKVLRDSNPTFKDTLGYEYKSYIGITGTSERYYTTDELSFEFKINQYNYKFATLQGKDNDETLGIKDGMYYKISKYLYNGNTKQSLCVVERLIKPPYGADEPLYIDVKDIQYYFSIRPNNDMKSPSLWRYYLDAVSIINEHNKSIKRIIRAIKGKDDFHTVPIGKRDKHFPVIVLKWFIYELKLHTGMKVENVRELLNLNLN